MKKPLPPPPFPDLLKKIGPERLTELLVSVAPGLDDAYGHWDELRYKTPPEGLSLDEWWLLLKLGRLRNAANVPLVDKQGTPFQYAIPGSVLAQLHEIDSGARGHITTDDLIANPESRDRYIVSSLIQEAITSSQLEGASTTRKVAVEMLRSGRKPRDKSEQMIFNNYMAMQHIRDVCTEPLTPELVFELHRVLTEGTLDTPDAAGRLQRPDEKRVIVLDPRDNTILHEPPPAESLPERLRAMCAFANGDLPKGEFIHPIIRAITLHFWLAYDHPFEDGNGRTARALFYWSLLRSGYWLFEFISISQLLRKAPAQYARAFLFTETDGNDLTYFVLYQLNIMRRAIVTLHKYIQEKAEQLRALQRSLGPGAEFNHRQRALLAHALRHPGWAYTIQSHSRSHGVVRATARADLLELEAQGLLIASKPGRAITFRAPADLEERLAARRQSQPTKRPVQRSLL